MRFVFYIMSDKGLSIDLSKVEAMRSWPTPRIMKKVHNFHGLTSFYCHFVSYFSSIIALLTMHEKVLYNRRYLIFEAFFILHLWIPIYHHRHCLTEDPPPLPSFGSRYLHENWLRQKKVSRSRFSPIFFRLPSFGWDNFYTFSPL